MDFDFSSALLRVRGAMVDAATSSNRRRLTVLQKAPCKKGCSGCCRRMVYITVAEAVVIQEYLEDAKLWEGVSKKCYDMLAQVRDSSSISWFRMNVACPVLLDDACLAYHVRPAACSVHFALSAPELCHPWATEEGEFLPVELEEVFLEFQRTLRSDVDGHGILALKMPLPASLIMAERIRRQPNLTIQGLMKLVYNELA